MRKGNQRLPAWLAGITALVATAGIAGAQEPGATSDSGTAAIAGIRDCTAASGATSGRCDETQSGEMARQPMPAGQTPRDEDAQTQMAQRDDSQRDETSKGFEGTSPAAQESASHDESQDGSGRLAGRSPDETPQTRVVPPAHATPAPASMTDAATTASTAASGQDRDDTGSASASTNDADSSAWKHGAPQSVARAQESISDRRKSANDGMDDRQDDSDRTGASESAESERNASDRAESMASEQDESPRSVPPEQATRMPEANASSSSATAANDRDSAASRSDAGRSDAVESSRSDTYASYGEDRENIDASSPGIAAAQSQFDALDADHDGTIDAAEAAVSTTLRAQFFTLDADGDGKISMAEFKGASDIASIRADRRERRQ